MKSIGSELRRLGYLFNEQGALSTVSTGEPFKFENQHHYDEVSVAVQQFIADTLVSKYHCQPLFIPLPSSLPTILKGGPMLPPSPPFNTIFISEDAPKNTDKLLLVIQGSGEVRSVDRTRFSPTHTHPLTPL